MISAALFVLVFVVGIVLSLLRGPFWGLLAYSYLYMNPPLKSINWWAEYLPDLRWSMLCIASILISMIIHVSKLSKTKIGLGYLLVVFYFFTLLLTETIAISKAEALQHTYYLLTYCVIVIIIIKVIADTDKLRYFSAVIIILCAKLSLLAIFEGKMVSDRLENIGPVDSNSSNEFGILLAAAIPLVFPFIFKGNKIEKILAMISLPLIVYAFVLCSSRGSFVSIFAGAIFVYLFVGDKIIRKYLIIATIIFLMTISSLSNESFRARIASLWEGGQSDEASLNSLSTGRTDTWIAGIEMAIDHPFGVGPDGFRSLAHLYIPQELLVYDEQSDRYVKAAHNSYLQVLVEQGVLGLFWYLLICFSGIRYLYTILKRIQKSGCIGSFEHFLLISMNASFVISLFGGIFGSQVYYEFFWWQYGMLIAVGGIMNVASIPLNRNGIK